MNRLIWPLAVVFLAVIAAIGGVLVTRSPSHREATLLGGRPPSGQRPARGPASPVPTVSMTGTARAPVTTPEVTDPWAVVSAYYADVESHRYRQAWTLIGSGAVTGQTYRQFMAGYACTGAEQLTELGGSRDQVHFDLAAYDGCTGQTLYYTGTDTVRHGRIVAARVTRIG